MARRVNKEGLVDRLDADIGWRRLELSALRTALQRAVGPAEATAARAAVTLAYAHWEGYVVTGGRALLGYVAGLRLKYDQLSDPYLALDDIVTRLALDPRSFELHYKWLDGELLRRRNSIAHGDAEPTDREFGLEALETVGDLLDGFRTEAQNAAVLEVFRR